MIQWLKYVFVLLVCFVYNRQVMHASPTINQYTINKDDIHKSMVDTAYDYFQTYFCTQQDSCFFIEEAFNNKSYNLTKHMLQLVDYVNTSDTIITLKFYSPVYRYTKVAEVIKIDKNKLYLLESKLIEAEKQFFTIRVLPKSIAHIALIYQPISFKDYWEQKNTVYKYKSIHDTPIYDTRSNNRNFRFTVEYMFILGMIFLMFIFYIIAYYYLHDKIYLYYTFYLIVTFLQVLYMLQYILSRNIKMFNIVGNSGIDEATKGLMIFFYSIFYKQAFKITKNEKVLYYSTEALKYISLLYVAIVLTGHLFVLSFYSEPFIYSLYRFPIFFFSILILVITYRIPNKSLFQKFIFFGSITYTVFTAISTLQKINFPFKDFYIDINLLYLGVALELIIFSIALIIRIKDSFLTSEKLKDELIVKLRQNEEFIKNENILLEKKVKDRVSEINQQNILIEEQRREALIQNYEKEKLEIQLQALSAQMNPHFIFNCMNSIQHLIITKQSDKASLVLHDFATLIRMVLEQSSQPSILLEDEIKLIKTYLKLEQERTNNSFDFEIYIDKEISTDFTRIPTMMIQPFLENALVHGFKFINYKGKIDIRFFMQDRLVRIEIEDNGIGRNSAKENKLRYRLADNRSVAIKIIQNRIDLLNKSNKEQKSSLIIEDLTDENNNAKGTKVIIFIPVI
ncbi:MAG: histidine kinase [Chitinophagales bacterium]